ncbi:hypothetical protein NQ314_010986 [Rhamnusium bicolor]|uniref:Serpin domain-containing protein n=1 Tax=Rhamnusium bicolor TaxID=1586634 RepID=A0AAV8XLJ0_9CUCU|nr:hypothetical protein NQ314_010986 [Rhamnusium bicolor]
MRCAIVLLALTCGALAIPVEDEAFQEFIRGNHKFSSGVYKEIKNKEKGNFIVSPLSAETILALTAAGAKGETAQEFITGLSLPSSKEKTERAFKTFLPNLKKSSDDLKLLSANKIYIADDVKLEEKFKNTATAIYDSGIENINFAKNVEATEKINGWVEAKTNNKIHDLVDPHSIHKGTRIVLVNSLYFSGKWLYKFRDSHTEKKKFFNTKQDAVEVDTMQQVEYLNYYENPTLNANFLELPYQGGDISMIIVLPNESEGLASLEKNYEQVFASQPFTKTRIDVELPKFSIESETMFLPILEKLGIRKAFHHGADFSGISSTEKNLVISNVFQKAFINVTEVGTEAAAATVG